MTHRTAPGPEELATLRDEFAARAAARELVESIGSDEPVTQVSMSRLFAYAAGATRRPDRDLDAALAASPALRATFRRMLEATAVVAFPRAAAASDQPIPARETDTARVTFTRSRQRPELVYAVVELKDPQAVPPTELVVFDAGDATHRVALPPPDDGIMQLILEWRSDTVECLKDPSTRVILH